MISERKKQKWKAPSDLAGYIYHFWFHLRRRAMQFGLPFELTRDALRKIWPINSICPVTGRTIVTVGGQRGPRPDSPFIYLITRSQGYVLENVVVISSGASRLEERPLLEAWVAAGCRPNHARFEEREPITADGLLSGMTQKATS